MQVLASQSLFLTYRKDEIAVPPLFWLVNSVKIGGHIESLSGPLFIPYTVSELVTSYYVVHNTLIICLSDHCGDCTESKLCQSFWLRQMQERRIEET